MFSYRSNVLLLILSDIISIRQCYLHNNYFIIKVSQICPLFCPLRALAPTGNIIYYFTRHYNGNEAQQLVRSITPAGWQWLEMGDASSEKIAILIHIYHCGARPLHSESSFPTSELPSFLFPLNNLHDSLPP